VKKLSLFYGLVCLITFLFASSAVYADVTEHPNLSAERPSLLAQYRLWAQQSPAGSTDMEEDEEYYEEDDEYYDDDEYEDEEELELIPDPWVEFNYGMWVFNDKMYFWVLKPVATVYKVVPEELRLAVKNIFYNIRFPQRFVNALLQGKGQKAKYEFGSFFINTTAGFLGMANVASYYPFLNPSPEDMGQTFAVWGIDQGAYLMVPFFGPYSLRHGMGRLIDTVLDPVFWAFWFQDDLLLSLAIRAVEAVNDTSLTIGTYEALKEAALDPYVMIRDAYVQNRVKLIAE
jgi:phospholipid-binding lipoprotein MlaA